MLLARFGVSQRRACRTVGIHRSTQRLAPPPVTAEEAELRAWLRKFSTDRPRWGWRRVAKMARRAGWKVNNKRVRRLWRDEGLRVPQRRRKKRLTGIGIQVAAMCPIRPNVIGEAPRDSWRLQPLRGWSNANDTGSTPTSCVSGRCGWCWIMARVRVAVGGDLLGRREAGPEGRDGALVGPPGRASTAGRRPGATTEELAELKRLKRENAELRRANDILKAAADFFGAELDRQSTK